ncbi:MAG: 3-phenylpropionate/trans-cinnamate dioxygenase ferredoxin reductase subunit [Gammaproteobacteria bacterium]|jgi:3-phenylpropionate/trans-cinnamate dioxygenase ferredoxin reductase subunit
MQKPIVIVGAGQAAASFVSRHKALANKSIGNNEPLILIGEEPVPPYQRPPLSKAYMSGDLERERLFIRPAHWYSDQNITTYYNTRVDSINPQLKQLNTSGGQTIDYGKLLLCTGSSPISLPAGIGGDLAGVFTLRNIADVEAMALELVSGRKLLIVGGGYIGLEAAAVARKFGLEVTVVEMAERILQRVAATQTSDFFRALHQQHDVDVRESTQLLRLTEENGRVNGAELANGERLEADLVLVGIGGRPNIELAEKAGLDCENGIAVNQTCQTSNPDIFSAGDCASFIRNGRRTRLESVQNAADQGDLIARVIAGEAVSYDPLPWFWSDQYDCKLQIAGLNVGYTKTVIRPGPKPGGQSVWYYAEDKLLAVDAMNDAMAYALGRKMIGAGFHPSPEQITNPDVDLKALSKISQ